MQLRSLLKVVSVALLAASFSACPSGQGPSSTEQGASPSAGGEEQEPEGLLGFVEARPGLFVGGRPSAAVLEAAAARDVTMVVSLLPPDPADDEAAQVRELGMTFVSIPVASAEDLTEERARKLGDALAQAGGHSVLLHCASGNRAGALLALTAYYVEGMNASVALELGERAGMTSLTETVRAKLMAECAAEERC